MYKMSNVPSPQNVTLCTMGLTSLKGFPGDAEHLLQGI